MHIFFDLAILFHFKNLPYRFTCTTQDINVQRCPSQHGTKLARHHVIRTQLTGSYLKVRDMDFPGGAVGKNPPANAGDTGSSPGPRRPHMPRNN